MSAQECSITIESVEAPPSLSNRLMRVRLVSIAMVGFGLFFTLITLPLVLLSPSVKMAVSFGFAPWLWLLVGIGLSTYWTRLARNERHYVTDRCTAWRVTCPGTELAIVLTGLETCPGWRDVQVVCQELPGKPGVRLPVVRLRVAVHRGDRMLRSAKLKPRGNARRLRATDRRGEPVWIALTQVWPDDVSPDLPWVVDVAVRGDPNPPDTLSVDHA